MSTPTKSSANGPFIRASPLVFALLASVSFGLDGAAQTTDISLLPQSQNNVTLEMDEGGNIKLLANGATRRGAIDRLFAGRNVKIEWRDESFANRIVNGAFSGSVEAIARRLLDSSTYTISYDHSDGLRISRVIIIGSSPPSITPPTGEPPRPMVLPLAIQPAQTREERRQQAAEIVRRHQQLPPSMR